jgi:integrase
VYRKVLLKLLQQGYNPYENNTDLHRQLQLGKNSSNQKTIEKPLLEKVVENTDGDKMPLKEALSFGLKLKEKLLSDTTIRSYKNRIDNFSKWLNENEPSIKTIDLLNKRIISSYLNSILEKTSARNRNNYCTDLSSILQVLEDNDIIQQNFVKKIPVLKSIPERNKTYTQDTQEEIFIYLEEKDPILLLYIKFISYNFLRPIEVCRLKVGDINLN